MEKLLLSGNEAIALGAYEAGVLVGAGYPGTPSTEILEHLTSLRLIVAFPLVIVLLVTSSIVFVADYKTNRLGPREAGRRR